MKTEQGKPENIYKKMVTEKVPEYKKKVGLPSNSKQVGNGKSNDAKNYVVDTCEITATLELSMEMKFIKYLALLPSQTIVAAFSCFLTEFAILVKSGKQCLMSYDTT